VLETLLVRSAAKTAPPEAAPFLEVVPFAEQRNLYVPGVALLQLRHRKRAYRLRTDAIVEASGSAGGAPDAGADGGAAGEAAGEAAGGVAGRLVGLLGRGAWDAVRKQRKFRLRSELGCLPPLPPPSY